MALEKGVEKWGTIELVANLKGAIGVVAWASLLTNELFSNRRDFPGSLVGIKDIDFVGRSEAETP